MKSAIRKKGRSSKRRLGRARAGKKKIVVALCLIAIMVLMWVRVLLKNKPAGADAAPPAQSSGDTQAPARKPKVSFIDLPIIPGRNDRITRDFFDSQRWKYFGKSQEDLNPSGSGQVAATSEDPMIARLAQTLKLGAIVFGERRQVMVNGELISEADTFTIKDGSQHYECEVVRILEGAVEIRCGDSTVKLQLVQTTGTIDQDQDRR